MSPTGSYTDGYFDCLNAALTYLWQTGAITNPQMSDLLRNTLLQQLIPKTGQNQTTTLSHGVATPGIALQVASVSDLGTSGTSHVNGLGFFDVSQMSTTPYDQRVTQIPDIYGLGTPGFSKVPFNNEVPMPCASPQFSTASISLSQSLPKSRFVPYKTMNRPALRNRNADSSNKFDALPSTAKPVRSDTDAWSLNDDIRYSIASFSRESSDKSDQPLAKGSSSKKLQENDNYVPKAMSLDETQRHLSAKVSSNVQVLESSRLDASTMSTRCTDETQRPPAAESFAAIKEESSKETTSGRETSSVTKDKSETGASSEKLNQDDVWRPF